MNPQRENENNCWQNDRRNPDRTLAFAGAIALFEVAVAATAVVGFFNAVSRPVDWTSVLQLCVCAGLVALLWRTDSQLAPDEAVDSDFNGSQARRQPVRRGSFSSSN